MDHARFHEDILASLADDGPREVYADKLQEHGDPRGEVISLSLAEARGKLEARQKRRLQELMRAHGTTWLGTLTSLCKRLRFERGFLATLDFTRALLRVSPEDLASVLTNPEVRFVRTIVCPGRARDLEIRLAPAMRSLADIYIPREDRTATLAVANDRHPRSWSSLRASAMIADPTVFAAVAASPSLRRVRELIVQLWPDDLKAFVAQARVHGWPEPGTLAKLHLELGAGYGVGTERLAILAASGIAELAQTVTWATPYGERGGL